MGDRVLLAACSGFRAGETGLLRLSAASAAYWGRSANAIEALAFSSQERLHYVADGRITEIELATGREVSSRALEEGFLCGLADDGRTVVVPRDEHAAFVVDAAGVRGPSLQALDTSRRRWEPTPLHFAGNRIWGVSGEMHKRVHVWDASTGESLLLVDPPVQLPSLHPSGDGTRAVMVWELGRESTIVSRLSLDEPEPREIVRFGQVANGYQPRAIAADTALKHAVVAEWNRLAVVDLVSGTVLRHLEPGGQVVALDASDDFRVLACLVKTSRGKRLEIWDPFEGRVVRSDPVASIASTLHWGRPLRVRGDGSSIAFADGTPQHNRDGIVAWDNASGARNVWADSAPRIGAVDGLLATDDGVTATGARVAVLDPRTLDELSAPPVDTSAVRTSKRSTISQDTWDVTNEIVLDLPNGVRETRVFRIGAWSTGGFERERVTPCPERVLAVCADPPRAITVFPSAVLAVDIYDHDSGNVDTASELFLWDLATDAPPRFIARVESVWLDAAAFSPDGAWIAWVAPRGSANLVDATTLATLETASLPPSPGPPAPRPTTAVAMAPDRRHWAVASGAIVMLRHIGIAEPIDVIHLDSAKDDATSLAFSADGSALFVGTRRGAVLRFDITKDR